MFVVVAPIVSRGTSPATASERGAALASLQMERSILPIIGASAGTNVWTQGTRFAGLFPRGTLKKISGYRSPRSSGRTKAARTREHSVIY